MPAKFVVKQDLSDMYYHVFNRGANQSEVFEKAEDYWMFRAFAKQARRKTKGKLVIDTFSILPNHFHFLILQLEVGAMTTFMRSLGVRYGMYFNSTRDHSGHVFQGSYKAKILPTKRDVRRTRQYILNNPIECKKLDWIHVGHVL